MAIQAVLGIDVKVERRPDGKPEVQGSKQVSVSHAGDMTLAVAAESTVGCDMETVAGRGSATWQALLGPDRLALAKLLAERTGEDHETAGTRVWAASESLKKAGAMLDAPLVLRSSTEDGWVLLGSGSMIIATTVVSVRAVAQPLVVSVLVGAQG
jgi:enediyne polyketide synthase